MLLLFHIRHSVVVVCVRRACLQQWSTPRARLPRPWVWLHFHCSARPALPSHLGTATPVITQITLYSTTADGQRCRPTTNKNTGVPSSSSFFYISGDERSETPKRSRTVEVGLFLISRGWEHSTRNPEGASMLRGMNVPHLLETTTPQTPTNSWDLRYFSLSFATKWFQLISS